jgi:hypothetical protein
VAGDLGYLNKESLKQIKKSAQSFPIKISLLAKLAG